MKMDHILLVDDDAVLRNLTADYLTKNGFIVTCAPDGEGALAVLQQRAFALVLLDIMMPGLDGLTVLRRLRVSNRVPVVMLTAKGDETDRVVGLEVGADDYLPKPFAPRELLARIRAVLRRSQGDSQPQTTLAVANVVVRIAERSVHRDGVPVELTGLEFDILLTLMQRAGRVVARDSLLTEAGRGATFVNERAVDVHVSHLRSKLGDDPKTPKLIKTVRGVGYVFAKDAT
jgi:DNA-binding response OmpR family regulator